MSASVASQLKQDAGYSVRSLIRSPGFTLVAVLTLALGIGANTAIFSVVRGILLRPLPFQDPSRLVMLGSTYGGGLPNYSSPTNVHDWKAQAHSFTSIATIEGTSVVLTDAGEPEQFRGYNVSADFFDILGVQPVAGRLTFNEAESAWKGTKSVLVNEALWRTRFGGDPKLVGAMITLDNERYQVVGIVPQGSRWPDDAMVWFPWTYDPATLERMRGAVFVQAIARLKPGVTRDAAQVEMTAISARLAQAYPDFDSKAGSAVVPLAEWITGDLRRPLLILLGGVGFVLLIACANVANLLLVRGVARGGELALRTALGATRGRLIRQLVTESVILSLVGGTAGLVLALWGTQLLVNAAPASIPRLGAVHVDGLVLAFTLGIAVITGIAFGLLPARHVVRADIATTLREGGRGGVGRVGGHRARRALVVAEVALSMMLLAGAGLLIRSFDRLMRVDPGFRAENSISFSLSLPDAKYEKWEARSALMASLMERMHALAGVQRAGASMGLPLTRMGFDISFEIAGRPPLKPNEELDAEIRVATPDYFPTMGIAIVKGRGFTDADRAGSPKVLLITETAAKQFFPNEDPIGKHATFGWGRGAEQFQGDIVGIVADVKQRSLARATLPQFWGVYDQRPVQSFAVVLHTARDPQLVVADARRAVHEIDADLAVSQVRTLEQVVAESVAQPRFYMLLLTVFAGVALVLSAIGIYGVIAYLVGQRSREIGIRLALGASPDRVVRMIVREGAIMTGLGLTIGVGGALALTQLMKALLFGVQPTDPTTYVVVTVLLAVIALAASCVPALRAARVDPSLAMRSD